MPSSPDQKTVVQCACGAKLKVPNAALGHKVRCPKCGATFTAAQPKPKEAAQPLEDESSLLFEELARAERSAPTLEGAGGGLRTVSCPSCSQPMSGEAVVCMSCGYNRETGRTVKLASAKAAKAVSAATKLAKGAGTFALGTILSGIGALVGAALWLVVAVVTDLEIGWVALGVGGLAGWGMVLGYRNQNARAGVVAAVMAVVGIMAGKIGVYGFVIYSVVAGDTSDIRLLRAHVQFNLAEDTLDERGVFKEEDRRAQWESVHREAGTKVAGMSNDEIRKRAEEIKEDNQRTAELEERLGPDRSRLAEHRAQRRSERDALQPGLDRREEYIREEYALIKAMSETELKAEIEKLDQWEKGGKWDDEEYTLIRLTYDGIEQARERQAAQGRPYPLYLSREMWNDLYQSHRKTAEALPAAERKQRLLRLERETMEEEMRDRLARHEVRLRSMEKGLPHGDPQRQELMAAAQEQYKSVAGQALDAAVAQLDAWEEGGKDADAVFVRNQLIYEIINEAEANSRPTSESKLASPVPPSASLIAGPKRASDAEWKQQYEKAVAQADTIPAEQHLQQIKELHDRKMKRLKLQWEQRQLQEEAEGREQFKKDSAEVGKAFLMTLINPLNLLFFGLAVVTAYRMAAGGATEF